MPEIQRTSGENRGGDSGWPDFGSQECNPGVIRACHPPNYGIQAIVSERTGQKVQVKSNTRDLRYSSGKVQVTPEMSRRR
jgi:hypothetical protein